MAFPATFKYFSEEGTRPGGGDCAPACVAVFLDLTSGGLYDVGIRTSFGNTAAQMKNLRVDLVTTIRQWQSPPRAFGGGMSDAERLTAMRGGAATAADGIWAAEFAALSLAPPSCKNFNGKSWDSDFLPDIIAGRGAVFSLKYGPVDWYPATVAGFADSPTRHTISGQWRFTGGHSLAIAPGTYATPGGIPTVTVIDPLGDGRFSSSTSADHGSTTTVVNGPTDMPVSVLKKGAGLWAGTGKVNGVTFTYAAATGADPHVITSIVGAGLIASVTTQAAHGLSSGDFITISGSNSSPSIDGNWTIVGSLGATDFEISAVVTGSGSTGTWAAGDTGPPPTTDPCRG